MQKLFGTDGIRGQANRFLNGIGRSQGVALAHARLRYARGDRQGHAFQGYMLRPRSPAACPAGDVFLVGPVPTPAVAHLTLTGSGCRYHADCLA